MNKDNDYYRSLDLRRLGESVPANKEARGQNAAFHEMLIALALRYPTEPFTDADLLAHLGEPDTIEQPASDAVWEYTWHVEYCSFPYRSSTPSIVQAGRVVGIWRRPLTPAS